MLGKMLCKNISPKPFESSGNQMNKTGPL